MKHVQTSAVYIHPLTHDIHSLTYSFTHSLTLTITNTGLPFVFVQLQPCGIPPAQRYAQAAALELSGVAMATAVDLQDAGPAGAAPCPGAQVQIAVRRARMK